MNRRATSSDQPKQRRGLRRHHSMPLITSWRRIKSVSAATAASNPHYSTAVSPSKQAKDYLSPSIPHGHCPLCGTKLFKFSSAFWRLNRKKRQLANPLTIPGKVENGHCLQCEDITGDQPIPLPPPLERQINILYQAIKDVLSDSLHKQSKQKFVYEGEYNIYGQRHGEGQMIWDDGSKYVGSFFNGLRDGKGKLLLSDGSEYEGEWDLNEMHGYGRRRFVNQDFYIGQYTRGKRCGLGKMHFADDDLYVGTWQNDKFHGRGKYFLHARGVAMEGNFEQGRKTGKFKIQHANGSLDIFRFKEDKIIGHGVRWNANRDKTWMLTKPCSSDECWFLGQKAKMKRIPIVQAVSIGYECEDNSASSEPLPTMLTLATAVPHANGRAII